MKKEGVYFENLDSIRFIAAMMVFLQHALRGPSNDLADLHDGFLKHFLRVICSGGIGVSIFFVLSGFLITYLLIAEYELNAGINLRNFYIRRTLRIWPLYFAVVVFSFFVYPYLKHFIGMDNPYYSRVGYYLCFLSNFDVINIEKHYPGLDAISQNVTWSVSVEEQFYLFWPLIFAFLPRRAWLYAILVVIASSILFRIYHHADVVTLYFHTLSVLLDLGIGALFAYLVTENKQVRNFFEQTSTKSHIAFFLLSLALLIWGEFLFSFTNYSAAIGRIFISVSFGLIITSQALTLRYSPLNLKNWSFAHKWGKYTYGIYLLHPIVILTVEAVAKLTHISLKLSVHIIILAIIEFILTLAISKLSYTYFEAPFLKFKKKFEIIKAYSSGTLITAI